MWRWVFFMCLSAFQALGHIQPGCNRLKLYAHRTEVCLTELKRMGGGVYSQEDIPFPNKLYNRISHQNVDSQLAFVRDSLGQIFHLYRSGNLSCVGWDAEGFLTVLYNQMSLISHCVSPNRSENLDVRKYYERLLKTTVKRTNGSLTSWQKIRYITRIHLHHLNRLVDSIVYPMTKVRYSRETAPKHTTTAWETALEHTTRRDPAPEHTTTTWETAPEHTTGWETAPERTTSG